MLSCKDISKSYDDLVLSNFNLEVEDNEIVALLGSSGSGKSTLLRIICGLEKADSGKILFNGVDLEEIPPDKRGIGMVFQNLALFPHLNVYENIKFGLPSKSSTNKIYEILNLVGLKDFATRKIQNLSGGESQRVALARSLIAQPKMILLDEPLSSLDSGIKESLSLEVRKMIKSLSIPAIYVTHDPQIAEKMADRIVYLD